MLELLEIMMVLLGYLAVMLFVAAIGAWWADRGGEGEE